MKKYAMVFDAGTGAGRCNLFDMSGRLVSYAYREWEYLKDLSSSNKEAMLFDVEQFKKILFSLCRKVITQAGISADEVVAVSATSQREGMVWLDRFGKEIYAAPSVDLRGEEAADILSGKEPFIKEITGLPVSGMFGLARLLWYKKFNEAVYDRIDTVMMISDWICYLLCGSKVSEPSVASSSQLFDVKNGKWSSELLKSVGLRTDIFPEISVFGEQIGTVTKEAACETGLKEGTPVICGAADSQAGLVGMNVLKSGMLAAVAGTTTPVMRVTDRYEIDEFAFTNRHGVPGLWLQEGNAGITGLALRWVRDLFRTDYEIMTQEAMSVPLGCDGMRCFSGHEIAGRRSSTCRSGFVFPTPWVLDSYKRGHFFRAVYEANCYAVRANLEAIKADSKAPLYVCGGQTASDFYNGILADVCGRQVITQKEREITGLGIAMGAFTGVGLYKDIREAAAEMSFAGKIYEPKHDCQAFYEDWLEKY